MGSGQPSTSLPALPSTTSTSCNNNFNNPANRQNQPSAVVPGIKTTLHYLYLQGTPPPTNFTISACNTNTTTSQPRLDNTTTSASCNITPPPGVTPALPILAPQEIHTSGSTRLYRLHSSNTSRSKQQYFQHCSSITNSHTDSRIAP